MIKTKSLVSAIVAASLVGGIGFVYAQSADSTSSPSAAGQFPNSTGTNSAAPQTSPSTSPSTSPNTSATPMDPPAAGSSSSNSTNSSTSGTTDAPASPMGERPAQADRG